MDHIIIFDGDCSFCRIVVSFIRKRDKRKILRMIAQQSAQGRELIADFNIPEKDTNSVIYITNGKYLLRSTAVLNILKDLGGWWKGLFVFIVVPRFLRDGLYRVVARMRASGSSPFRGLGGSGGEKR